MQDQRNTHGFKRSPRQFGPMLGGAGRQNAALDMREVDAPPLEYRAAFNQTRDPIALQPTSGLALPAVTDEILSVRLLQTGDDAGLQPQQIIADALAVHRRNLTGLANAGRFPRAEESTRWNKAKSRSASPLTWAN